METKIMMNNIKRNMNFAKKQEENSFSLLDQKIDSINDKVLNFVKKKSDEEVQRLKNSESELKNLQSKKIKEELEKEQFVSSISNKMNNLNENLSKLNEAKKEPETKKKQKAKKPTTCSKFILTKNKKQFHLLFGKYQFHLNKDMTKAMRFSGRMFYFIQGKYNKDFIKMVDTGDCNIFEENNKLFATFNGSKFKKTFHFETGNKSFYKIKQDEQKEFSNIKSKFIDFSSVLSSQIKFPYTFKTGAFSEGTWHNTFYSWEVIKNAAPKIMNSSLVTHHIDDTKTILTEVGKVISFEIDEENKRLNIEGELFETTAGKDTAILLANKRIPDVSVRIKEDSEDGTCNEILEWGHVAFVREGEVTDAKIQYKK